jgi:hypothetical protein
MGRNLQKQFISKPGTEAEPKMRTSACLCPPGFEDKPDLVGCRYAHDSQTNILIIAVVVIICFLLAYISIKSCPQEFTSRRTTPEELRRREIDHSGLARDTPPLPKRKLDSEDNETDDTGTEPSPYDKVMTTGGLETEHMLFSAK